MSRTNSWTRRWARRLRTLLRPRAVERELDEELAFHLAMETEKLRRAGLSDEEARRRARLAFGGMEGAKEGVRDERWLAWAPRFTLDLLILKALSLEAMHGWAIAQRIEQLSRDALHVGQGSLYPALQRLEYKGWIDSDWNTTDQNRRAKYYRLTAAGRRQLDVETEDWRRISLAISSALKAT